MGYKFLHFNKNIVIFHAKELTNYIKSKIIVKTKISYLIII